LPNNPCKRFGVLTLVSVENGAARQFYRAVYTIYPRKMLRPGVSLSAHTRLSPMYLAIAQRHQDRPGGQNPFDL